MSTASRRSFLQTLSLSALGIHLPQAHAEATSGYLPRDRAEALGVSSSAILDFLKAMEQEKVELHSFMMLRHGQVIAEGWWEPYGPELVHTMYSMSKSFTSTAVGFAVAEGKLSVEDKVVSFFPDDLPAQISENLVAMRVKDLLTMTPGNEKEPTGSVTQSENWVRAFLAQKIIHKPGTHFLYNSVATYMCSAIVQKVTGQTILDYLTPRLFTPLGISGMRWETCPRGINTGGWGLSIQTEGLAKFGQLLLQKGKWQGQQIIPAAWIDEATSFHVQQPGGDKPDRPKAKNDWLQGYGYQFWRCQGTAFRGDGAFGQFTIVLPEQEAVIVMTSENKNMQGQLDLVWKHLLPAFDTKPFVQADLASLKSLKLLPPQGSNSSAIEPTKPFKLEANDYGLSQISLALSDKACVLSADGHSISCGWETWQLGETALPIKPPRLIAGGKPKSDVAFKVAAHATWTDPQTLLVTLRYYETPHSDALTFRFDGDSLTLTLRDSITAMNPKGKDSRAPLKGKVS